MRMRLLSCAMRLAIFAAVAVLAAQAQTTWWVQSADYGAGNRRQDVTQTVKRLVNGPRLQGQ